MSPDIGVWFCLESDSLTNLRFLLYTQSMEKSSSRWWDWSSAVLLYLLILISTWRLSVTDWTPDLDQVRHLATLGTVIGLALGYSQYKRRAVSLFVLDYTVILIPYQLMKIFDSDIELRERALSLLGRWLFSIQELVLGNPVNDPLLFVTLLSIIYWIIGLTAGYYLVRRANFLAAVLPAGFVMLVVHMNDNGSAQRAWLIAVYLLFSLILMGRQNYLLSNAKWKAQNIHTPPETSFDFTYGALVIAVIFVFVSWTGPSMIPPAPEIIKAWNHITKPWRESNDRLDDLFASLKRKASASDYYKDVLTLGQSAPQSKEIVFTVSTPPEALQFPRLYWRGRVYDRFENGRWQTTPTENQPFSPLVDRFKIADSEKRVILPITFTVAARGQSMLYMAAPFEWVSRPGTAKVFNNSDGSQDVVVVFADPYFESGETYQANAALNNPFIEELRAAGQDYPDWVNERYLQLPDNFSPRLRAVAEEATADKTTSYDKAAALTDYLRKNVAYKTELVFPLGITDPLEYAILDLKQGFCNYFATAETLMLRSVGIPARLAVGYAQGEPNVSKDTYTVRGRDAHAWPEVYFPGSGWVEFEPTGNQAPLVRSFEKAQATPTPDASLDEISNQPKPITEPDLLERNSESGNGLKSVTRNLYRILNIILTIGLILAGIFLMRRYSLAERLPVYLADRYNQNGNPPPRWLDRWARWANLTSIEKSFEAVNWSLRRLRHPQPVHMTPSERAQTLRELLPQARASIDTLAAEHQRALYTPRAGSAELARRASVKIIIETLRARFLEIW